MRNLRTIAVAASALLFFGAMSGPVQAATTLDQSYETWSTSVSIPTGGLAQVVTPGITGQLTSVDVRLWYSGSPTQGVTVGIRNVSGGLPAGSDLASGFVPDTSIGGVAAWLSVPLSTPVSVTAGTQFAIVVTTTNNANDYKWRVDAAGTYAGGDLSVNLGSWSILAGDDANFRTYVNTSDTGPTPPPVLQQFGMPASGTCDAAAPIVLNWGGAGSGGWGNSWAEWMNSGRGGAVCTRTLIYSNALGHWIVG
jgi:hypothetical protein